MTLDDQTKRELSDLVRKHKVVYDVQRAATFVTGERRDIGFDLELRGTHEPSTRSVLPGCHKCVAVYEDLKRIGQAVLPTDPARISFYDIRGFDRALHSERVGERDDVELAIEIRHKEEFLGAIDPCEERCLEEMKQNLQELGAQSHRWRQRA